jgi:hypothetical protein
MGDWCSEDDTDTVIQRKYGTGKAASNRQSEMRSLASARKKIHFPCPREVFPLTEGLLMGDPITITYDEIIPFGK